MLTPRRIAIAGLWLLLIGSVPKLTALFATDIVPRLSWWPARWSEVPLLVALQDLAVSLYAKLPYLQWAGLVLVAGAIAALIVARLRSGAAPEHDAGSGPLGISDVLIEEARQINGKAPDESVMQAVHAARARHRPGEADVAVRQLCVWLNGLDRSALCLSGGGIRSASFALGVLQALAAHPRGADGKPMGKPEASLLARFHFLSTVSGGGYIGSWLSSWVRRVGYSNVHRDLVRTPEGVGDPGEEPLAIRWLREHSNFLTPRLGLTSADTLTGVAIFARNLVLNWLVLLPALFAGLIIMKLVALALFWLHTRKSMQLFLFFGLCGLFFQYLYLRFALRHRPSLVAEDGLQHEQPDTSIVIRRALVPAFLAAICYMLCLTLAARTDGRYPDWVGQLFQLRNDQLDLPAVLAIGALFGSLLYGINWVTSWPKGRGGDDFWRWCCTGAIYGMLVGVTAWFFSRDFAGNWIFYTALEWFKQGFDWVQFYFDPTRVPKRYPADEYRHVLILLLLGVPMLLLAQMISEMLFVGLASYQRHSDEDREWLGRASGMMLLWGVGWFVLMYLVYVGGHITFEVLSKPLEAIALLAALFATGIIASMIGKSDATPAQAPEGGNAKARSANLALTLIAALSVVLIIVTASALVDLAVLGHPIVSRSGAGISIAGDAEQLFYALVIAVSLGIITSRTINVNRFSMHAVYRNRLVRTFLGASRDPRDENPFTRFDRGDNPRMQQLWGEPNQLNELEDQSGAVWQPFHIVNIALNITSSSKNLRWQERKAGPFTVSPLHAGSAFVGYRSSSLYGRGSGDGGISLGTAVAVSGAAASPNQGYNSSAPVAFLMGLFNVRLGWWLGNPGPAGAKTFMDDGPKIAILPLLSEMLGIADDEKRYVYLSDGGHFENLALYEMVRRRCQLIVVSDAGCDPDFAFEDLGNAVRKIEIDLGVPIRFHGLAALKARPRSGPDLGPGLPYHAIGEIDYPAADGGGAKGIILYIKPGYHGSETGAGIRSYAISNHDFPHDSTANQWFGESQLESYRSLGFEITDNLLRSAEARIAREPQPPTLREILTALRDMQAEAQPAAGAAPRAAVAKPGA